MLSGLPAYLVYCVAPLAKCTLYGHYVVRALDVLFDYWPCLYGKHPMADRYNPHSPVELGIRGYGRSALLEVGRSLLAHAQS